MRKRGHFQAIRELGRDELNLFVDETITTMIEEEALAVLRNPHCDSSIVTRISQSPVASRYAIRAALVGHRQTPQGHAMKFVHHLKWHDLLRYSTEVRISVAIRRAIEEQMKVRLPKLTLGEKIAAAKFCTPEIAKVLFRDPDRRVLEGLLNNSRVTEPLLIQLIERERLSGDQLTALSEHPRWKERYPLRRSIARCTATPRAVAASQLLHLTNRDLEDLRRHPNTSLYLHRCIERLGLLDKKAGRRRD